MSREIEKTVHHGVSVSRWLLAPMYRGLAIFDWFRALAQAKAPQDRR